MRTLLHFFILLTVVATPAGVSAQAHVEKAVAQVQKSAKGSVSYKVQRDHNKNIVNSSLYISFNDLALAKSVIEAIKKDADSAAEYCVNTNSSKDGVKGTNYSIVFESGKGKRSSYSIMTSNNGASIVKATIDTRQGNNRLSSTSTSSSKRRSIPTSTVKRRRPLPWNWNFNKSFSAMETVVDPDGSSTPYSISTETTTRTENGNTTVTKRHVITRHGKRSIVITTETADGDDEETLRNTLDKLDVRI